MDIIEKKYKLVRLTEETHARLTNLKRGMMTYNDVVDRLIKYAEAGE